ncbi:MAG TPA: LysR family transcriptional regulator [Candidatus Binatia bacterium]|nr:LysR family transcriptional regulator [Candidatus Binatia bacterium]
MLVKQLTYLTALARERHFGRAAESCGITQPALSAAIRQIEAELGVRIVERSRRFVGFTPEGQLVLNRAQRLVHDFDTLRQDLSLLKRDLAGRIRIGAIPAALPIVSLLTTPFCAQHASVSIHIQSLSSKEIQRGIDTFDLDLGLTYLDNEALSRVRTLPIYRDRFVFITHDDPRFAGLAEMTWREAAGERLCLLSNDMQNRRIIDRAFESVGEKPHPVIEANALITLMSHVRLGQWSSIVPQSLLLLTGISNGLKALPMTDPKPVHSIGFVHADRDPTSGLIAAFLATARLQKLQQRIDDVWKGQSGLAGANSERVAE